MNLRPRQARFVIEYIRRCDGQAAAIAAGYAPSSARVQAAKLLTNPAVKRALRDEQDAAAARLRISADKVLREMSIVAFSDLGDFLDFSGDEIKPKPVRTIDTTKRRAAKQFKVKHSRREEKNANGHVVEESFEVQMWDKVSALDKLGRHLGIFLDQDDVDELLAKADELRARAGTPAASDVEGRKRLTITNKHEGEIDAKRMEGRG